MTKKELKIFDKQIQYLCEYSQDKIKSIRQVTGINPGLTFLKEIETIEYLYKSLLEDRKIIKSNYLYTSTSGWTVEYIRDKKKYKKNEKFKIRICFSFVSTDNLED